MFFIDLNHCYFKVVNAGKVWGHNLDDLQWLVPDDELAHVRRGKKVAVMPLATIHQWLYPFGPFDARTDSYPREYVDSALKRRTPVNIDPLFDDFRDEETHCGCYHCDGTCEQCSDQQRQQREYNAYMEILDAERIGVPIKRELGPSD